jgi:hypothetical protein
MSDSTFRKIIRPVDARGLRGVFSRGKPVYRGGFNSPKPKQNVVQQAILERYKNARSNRHR